MEIWSLKGKSQNLLEKKLLSDAIKELPEKEQLMMSMYYVEGMNLKEIGLVLEVSESSFSNPWSGDC